MGTVTQFEQPLPGSAWLNLKDPASPALDELTAREGFHPLDLEDCRHRNQIAKVTEHDGYCFIVIKTISFEETEFELEFHDFDIFMTASSITTIEEGPGATVVANAAARLGGERGPVPPWRINHALLDAAVDEYLPVLDRIGDVIDDVESAALDHAGPEVLQKILKLKRVLIQFHRNAAAMREVLNHLVRSSKPTEDHYLYLRDVYEHLVRVLDFIETYRDLVSGCLDIYLSAIANRTNEIVKVLTIWGTIALPLIVITGFYGMNLDLPLQRTQHPVLLVAALMTGSTVAIVLYFRRRGWM